MRCTATCHCVAESQMRCQRKRWRVCWWIQVHLLHNGMTFLQCLKQFWSIVVFSCAIYLNFFLQVQTLWCVTRGTSCAMEGPVSPKLWMPSRPEEEWCWLAHRYKTTCSSVSLHHNVILNTFPLFHCSLNSIFSFVSVAPSTDVLFWNLYIDTAHFVPTDHCMVNFIKTNLLGSLSEFRNRFINPIQNGQCADSTPRDVRIMKKRAHVLYAMLAGCVQVTMEYCQLRAVFARWVLVL